RFPPVTRWCRSARPVSCRSPPWQRLEGPSDVLAQLAGPAGFASNRRLLAPSTKRSLRRPCIDSPSESAAEAPEPAGRQQTRPKRGVLSAHGRAGDPALERISCDGGERA